MHTVCELVASFPGSCTHERRRKAGRWPGDEASDLVDVLGDIMGNANRIIYFHGIYYCTE